MRNTLVMGLGLIGLIGAACCAFSEEQADKEDGERDAQETADKVEEWGFRYDETRQEVTACRGAAVLVYPLRDMGAEGATLMTSFKGYDGATWTLPNDDSRPLDRAEALGQNHEPLVSIGPPPPVRTPGYTTPPLPFGHGNSHHGPPPGWNSATWGKACQIAAVMATSFGCSAIMADCVAGTVLTLGGVAVPCTLVTALACGVGAGAGASLIDSCPKGAK